MPLDVQKHQKRIIFGSEAEVKVRKYGRMRRLEAFNLNQNFTNRRRDNDLFKDLKKT